ncbi:MAG: hypothetical protein AB7K24_21885 [Gemmataceae bacterium]
MLQPDADGRASLTPTSDLFIDVSVQSHAEIQPDNPTPPIDGYAGYVSAHVFGVI